MLFIFFKVINQNTKIRVVRLSWYIHQEQMDIRQLTLIFFLINYTKYNLFLMVIKMY